MRTFWISLMIVTISLFKLNGQQKMKNDDLEVATFAGGCFWCTEAIFQAIKGVETVTSGYTGGDLPNPTYKQVSQGFGGHAEAVQIVFNPTQVSFNELLEIFFATHDPTTLNRQGADIGSQYRSVVFYHSDKQKTETLQFINQLKDQNSFRSTIVTQIVAAGKFYPAEKYHQNYYQNNAQQGYCQIVIAPKIAKFKKQFSSKLSE